MARSGAIALVALVWGGCGGRTTELVDAGGDDAAPEAGACPNACTPADADGDGHAAVGCGGDCDDGAPAVHPGAVDPFGDGIDQDCDGVDGVDHDRDGHLAQAAGGDDCDDSWAVVHPGANDGEGLRSQPASLGGKASRLAVEPDGIAHVVFSTGLSCEDELDLDDGGRVLNYATNRGGSWTVETIDSGCLGHDAFSMAVDAEGSAHIVYSFLRPPEGGVRYANNRSGEWTIEEMPRGMPGSPCNGIAVGPCDTVQMLFGGGQSAIHATATTDGGWAYDEFDGGGRDCSFALDGVGNDHLLYSTVDAVFHATNASGAWAVEVVQDVYGEQYGAMALVVGSDGRPTAVYTVDRVGTLLATRTDSGSWQAVTIDELARSYYYFRGAPSLAVDPSGAHHVTYVRDRSDDTQHSWYATDRSGTWTATPLAIDYYPQIAVDAHGGRHVLHGMIEYGTLSDPNDGIDQNCDGVDGLDADGDGHASRATGGDDVDDEDPATH